MSAEYFSENGFAVIPAVLDGARCDALLDHAAPAATVSGGTRTLLGSAWCAALIEQLRGQPALGTLLPDGYVAVQCTYFEKSSTRNWLVAMHQDLSIPVAERTHHPALRGWSEKQGQLFVQPPTELLEQLVAVRLHLDACTAMDGPLRVVPGSHRRGRIGSQAAQDLRLAFGEVACEAPRGAALIMRPLLLHASSKALGDSRRRVLHILFGPRELPFDLRWRQAA